MTREEVTNQLAQLVRLRDSLSDSIERLEGMLAAEPPLAAVWVRCQKCLGSGYVGGTPQGAYCTCELGRDLERQADRAKLPELLPGED